MARRQGLLFESTKECTNWDIAIKKLSEDYPAFLGGLAWDTELDGGMIGRETEGKATTMAYLKQIRPTVRTCFKTAMAIIMIT